MPRRRTSEAVQYTIRNVPPSLDRELRRRAKRLDKSLNEVALEALARGVEAKPPTTGENDDLEFLFGSWVDDPAVDRALEEQRKLDAHARL